VSAVIEMQRALAAQPWPEDETVRVRMGIHRGEASRTAVGLVGFDVHRAARLAAAANGGQVVLSASAADGVRESIPSGAELLDLGLHQLKDLPRPEQVFQLVADGLASSFPPLRSLDNPRLLHNLPAQISSFVGRTVETATISSLVTTSRLVTLTGAGGVGKTRLALQVAAHELECARDGVWFIDLAPLGDESLVAATTAKVLGIPVGSRDSVEDTLVDGIGQQRLFIVLDNCEHVIDACARLTDGLVRRCPNVVVLATSREPLGVDGEHVHRVPSLTLPGPDDAIDASLDTEATRLFIERAAQHGVSLEWSRTTAQSVGRICRLLDGIPLALELAASRLRMMSVVDLEARLDERFSLLTGGSRAALPRHRTLLATVEWSWDLLNAAEQDTMSRLSVFAGGFDLAAAEGVVGGLGDAGGDTVDVLGALVDKNLVQFDDVGGPVRYRLSETIRQFSTRQLAARSTTEVTATRTSHRDYYLAFAERAAPELESSDQARWLDLVDLDLDNLRAAISYSLEQKDPAPGLRLVNALGSFLKFRGHAIEGSTALLELLQRERTPEPTALRAASLITAATLLEQTDSYATSEPLCQEALRIGRMLGDHELVARALHVEAFLLARQGRYDDALALAEEALDVARKIGETRLTARLLGVRSFARECLGDRDGAMRDGVDSLAMFRKTGDLYAIGTSLGNLGYAELSTDALDSARTHLLESLEIARSLNDHYGVVYGTFNLGLAECLGGSPAAAHRLFTESLDLARRIGMRASTAYALVGLAVVAGPDAEVDAARLHGAADSMLTNLGEALEPLEASLSKRSRDALRSSMGAGPFNAEYETGRTLALEEILASASGNLGHMRHAV
jgi:predicted ATPase